MNITFIDSRTNDVLASIDNVPPSHMIYAKNDKLEFDHHVYIIEHINHRFTKTDSGIIHSRTRVMCMHIIG